MSRNSHSEARKQLVRLFLVANRLNARCDGERLNAPELAQACGCSTRTIYRDLDILAEDGFVPWKYDPAARSYVLLSKSRVLPTLALSAEDTFALALARGLAVPSGFPASEQLVRAFAKITASLPASLQAVIEEASRVLTVGSGPRDYSSAPILELLDACRSRETLEVDYFSRSSNSRRWRRFDPYHLEQRDGIYLELHGWCHERQRISTFALDQVHGARPTGERFVRREAAWKAFQDSDGVIGGLRGGTKVAVSVRFAPVVAQYALDQDWGKTLHVKRQSDGSVSMTGAALGTDALVKKLLSWGRHLTVTGGPELLAAMADEARAVAALYDAGQKASGEKS